MMQAGTMQCPFSRVDTASLRQVAAESPQAMRSRGQVPFFGAFADESVSIARKGPSKTARHVRVEVTSMPS